MRQFFKYFIAIILIATISTGLLRYTYAPKQFQPYLKTQQNALIYVEKLPYPLVTSERQNSLAQKYLAHYFSVWGDQDHLKNDEEIKQSVLNLLEQYRKNPGWDSNGYPHTAAWINRLTHLIDLKDFPKSKKAITVEATPLRILPTWEPSFSDPKQSGEGYPFDNLQVSWIDANTPILVLSTTLDGNWSLVLLSDAYGWIPTQALAYVDPAFIQAWTKKTYITTIKREVIVSTKAHNLSFTVRPGTIFPMIQESRDLFTVLIAVRNAQHDAVTKSATIHKTDAQIFPWRLTYLNLATLINQMMGITYGWGGLNGNYDCSLMVLTLFKPFGIWLPRNSADQAQAGYRFDLTHLDKARKLNSLKNQAVPLLTLFNLKGHVMLYLGQHDQTLFVFNSLWGLHTRSLLGSGRSVIGKSVIMPLTIDQGYWNIPTTFLDKITSFTRVDLDADK
jgi:cell wall-associated NlpC family hydrolase